MGKFSDVITIRLPAEWREIISEIISKEGYSSPAEYIRSLIREDLKRRGFLKEVRK